MSNFIIFFKRVGILPTIGILFFFFILIKIVYQKITLYQASNIKAYTIGNVLHACPHCRGGGSISYEYFVNDTRFFQVRGYSSSYNLPLKKGYKVLIRYNIEHPEFSNIIFQDDMNNDYLFPTNTQMNITWKTLYDVPPSSSP